MPSIPAGSIEYLTVPVTTTTGGVPVTPAVEIALVPSGGTPAAGDWRDAAWADGAARVLVQGLPAGTYLVHVRITDTPEVVLRRAGTLTIT